ncbi:response regulator transcription factor [Yoonia sp. 2307UL14-13]|uniref:response regulator transcription factor n=1 Tax=Yoonia sp. 2307UL14-13 TaxID=3126506 RepID=UPI0030A35CFB
MEDVPRLIICDDHEIIRDSISRILTDASCANVVGSACDGYTAIKMCRNLDPDIFLMDLAITRPKGSETFRKLMSIKPDLKIVIYSSEAEKAEIFALIAEGAKGFVPKQAKASNFVNAVRSISLGYVCIPDDYVNDFMCLRQNTIKTGNIYGLSPREIEILEACVSGVCTKQVAERFDISVRTVETHRNAIYRKTSCNSVDALHSIAEQMQLPVAGSTLMRHNT